MDHRANDFASALERLTARLADLELRISSLEKGSARVLHDETPAGSSAAQPQHAAVQVPAPSVSLISVLGKSILGIAGAYLLRAAAETAVFPKLGVVLAALLYAWLWQYLSVRAVKSSQAAAAAYGITSALILFPMLWEITVGFRILPPNVTAIVLVVFVISALILSWSGKAVATVWATAVFSSCTALGLLVVTRDPFPFALALISTSALFEFAACREQAPGLRFATAIPMDLALVSLLYLASRPEGFPPEYLAIPKSTLLVLFSLVALIFAAGTVTRSFRPPERMSLLDVGQSAVSFGLLLMATLYLGGAGEVKQLGAGCLVAGAGAYGTAFFSYRIRIHSQKFHIYASWAVALFLIGSTMMFQRSLLIPWLSLSGVLATGFAVKFGRLTLGIHGFCLLVGAQIGSGLAAYGAQVLVGSEVPLLPPSVWWAAMSAGACSLILWLRDCQIRGIRILQFCFFADAALLLSAFSVAVTLTILQTGNAASPAKLALIRSIVICVLTLLMALLGAFRKREELVWVAYTMIGLGTLKLIFEDLRFGSTGSFALSLLGFGVVLAIIPRIVRLKNQEVEQPKPD